MFFGIQQEKKMQIEDSLAPTEKKKKNALALSFYITAIV